MSASSQYLKAISLYQRVALAVLCIVVASGIAVTAFAAVRVSGANARAVSASSKLASVSRHLQAAESNLSSGNAFYNSALATLDKYTTRWGDAGLSILQDEARQPGAIPEVVQIANEFTSANDEVGIAYDSLQGAKSATDEARTAVATAKARAAEASKASAETVSNLIFTLLGTFVATALAVLLYLSARVSRARVIESARLSA